MVKLKQLILLLIATFLLNACENSDNNQADQVVVNNSNSEKTIDNKETNTNKQTIPLAKDSFKMVEWPELMPKDDLDALLNPPEYLSDIEDGSEEDQISSQIQSTIAAASDDRYQQALVSTNIVEEMNGKAIKIPGFIVPIEFNDQQTVTQFFLVPFFGACLHMPPPPPNQIIFVDYPKGLQLPSLYDPFWISGILQASLVENEIATSSYSIVPHYIESYYDE